MTSASSSGVVNFKLKLVKALKANATATNTATNGIVLVRLAREPGSVWLKLSPSWNWRRKEGIKLPDRKQTLKKSSVVPWLSHCIDACLWGGSSYLIKVSHCFSTSWLQERIYSWFHSWTRINQYKPTLRVLWLI